MILTDEEKKMYQGEYGPGVQKAMSLLIEYGKAFSAERMIKAASAHIMPDGSFTLLKEMLEGATARIPTTIHSRMEDPTSLPPLQLDNGYDMEKLIWRDANRIEMFKEAGCLVTPTCIPYLIGNLPKRGEVASWVGSSGQIIVNSWYGVRANRDGASATLACAITGRVPYMGVLKPENRYGQVLVELEDLDPAKFSNAHYGALSYYIGDIAETRNVVYNGLPGSLSLEQFKYLCSPLAVSGGVSICHVVGVTPDASTLEQALGNKKPAEVIQVGKKQIKEAWEALTTVEDDTKVDLVSLGCPHLTIMEIREIASLLENKKVHGNVRLTIGTSKPVYALAKANGYTDIVEKAGGIFLDTCVGGGNPAIVFNRSSVVAATNSPRAAHYMTRLDDVQTFYGDYHDCIAAALTGEWRGKLWK